MKRKENDELIGLAVVALAVALSLLAGGLPALFYGAGFVVFGVIILVLLNRQTEGARLIAIILMPAVLLGKLLPKNLREQLRKDERQSDEK